MSTAIGEPDMVDTRLDPRLSRVFASHERGHPNVCWLLVKEHDHLSPAFS